MTLLNNFYLELSIIIALEACFSVQIIVKKPVNYETFSAKIY